MSDYDGVIGWLEQRAGDLNVRKQSGEATEQELEELERILAKIVETAKAQAAEFQRASGPDEAA